MQMLAQDRRLADIQEYVDARYAAQRSNRTPTPLPPLDYVARAYRPSTPWQ